MMPNDYKCKSCGKHEFNTVATSYKSNGIWRVFVICESCGHSATIKYNTETVWAE